MLTHPAHPRHHRGHQHQHRAQHPQQRDQEADRQLPSDQEPLHRRHRRCNAHTSRAPCCNIQRCEEMPYNHDLRLEYQKCHHIYHRPLLSSDGYFS